MRANIHPNYGAVAVNCVNCKNTFEVNSTVGKAITINSCPKCHPFISGKKGVYLDTTGRLDRFKSKFGAGNLIGAKGSNSSNES